MIQQLLSYFKSNALQELNRISFIALIMISLVALGFQVFQHELPCPLCLLERMGILAMGLGALGIVIDGIKTRYYGMSLLATMMTALCAGRQVLLHIVPGSGGYGSTILSLHMYSWTLFFCCVYLVYLSFALCVPTQFKDQLNGNGSKPYKSQLNWVLIILYCSVIVLNIMSVLSICGFGACPDNPVAYFMWLH